MGPKDGKNEKRLMTNTAPGLETPATTKSLMPRMIRCPSVQSGTDFET